MVGVLLTLISPNKRNGFFEEKFKFVKLAFTNTILLLFPRIKLEIVVFLENFYKFFFFLNKIT